MIYLSNVDEIIRKVWGNTQSTYEPFNGGFVNFTYKVAVDGRNYVLRINGRQNDYLGLSRESEIEALRLVGNMGIAPLILPQSRPEYLITDFIDAHTLTRFAKKSIF